MRHLVRVALVVTTALTTGTLSVGCGSDAAQPEAAGPTTIAARG